MFRAFQPSEALGTARRARGRAEAPGATLAREGTEANPRPPATLPLGHAVSWSMWSYGPPASVAACR
jgi:hypothetical protein